MMTLLAVPDMVDGGLSQRSCRFGASYCTRTRVGVTGMHHHTEPSFTMNFNRLHPFVVQKTDERSAAPVTETAIARNLACTPLPPLRHFFSSIVLILLAYGTMPRCLKLLLQF